MIRFVFASTMVLASTFTGAVAQTPAAREVAKALVEASQSKDQTVLEALNIGASLRQLGDHSDGKGQKVIVPFKFNGGVLMSMALNIAAAENIQKQYQQTYNSLVRQFADGGSKVPDEKIAEFNQESEKALNAPSGLKMHRIRASDLCMEAKPVAPCTVTNNIPPALLAAILPIIDQ